MLQNSDAAEQFESLAEQGAYKSGSVWDDAAARELRPFRAGNVRQIIAEVQ